MTSKSDASAEDHPNADVSTVASLDHYETLLAEVYDWMQGGWDHKVEQSRTLFETLSIKPSSPGAVAIDLGAGTGYQAIPLAELGFVVTAVDASATMLDQLRDRAGQSGLSGEVTVVEADICRYATELDGAAEVVVCMGDTLTHLPSAAAVGDLIADLHRGQAPGGRIVLGFRDGSQPLIGDGRFIPVRSDEDRVFTCFIEEIDESSVRVHDVVHQRSDGGFVQHVSSYIKIRLSTGGVAEQLLKAGYLEQETALIAGMTIISATKAS